MNNAIPSLSVILPVYNGQEYLAEAIESVLSQSFGDFELIIINDGSRDDSADVVAAYGDPRIRYFEQQNRGLPATLNRAISLTRGEYIARQDQDDVCLPSRFEKQVAFLDKHPDVGLVGTGAQIWAGRERTNRFLMHPTDNAQLKFGLLFDNYFVHSSVMMRRSMLADIGGYTEDAARQPPEDFELWSRAMKQYKLANLPEVLHAYREVEGSMSRVGAHPFLSRLIKLSAENIAWASGCAADAAGVIALSKLSRGVYEQIPQAVNMSTMIAILNRAALKVAEDSGVPVAQLNDALRTRVRKLRYHYFNLRCGGVPGRLIGAVSRVAVAARKIAG